LTSPLTALGYNLHLDDQQYRQTSIDGSSRYDSKYDGTRYGSEHAGTGNDGTENASKHGGTYLGSYERIGPILHGGIPDSWLTRIILR
jgi:hypothetical protein